MCGTSSQPGQCRGWSYNGGRILREIQHFQATGRRFSFWTTDLALWIAWNLLIIFLFSVNCPKWRTGQTGKRRERGIVCLLSRRPAQFEGIWVTPTGHSTMPGSWWCNMCGELTQASNKQFHSAIGLTLKNALLLGWPTSGMTTASETILSTGKSRSLVGVNKPSSFKNGTKRSDIWISLATGYSHLQLSQHVETWLVHQNWVDALLFVGWCLRPIWVLLWQFLLVVWSLMVWIC